MQPGTRERRSASRRRRRGIRSSLLNQLGVRTLRLFLLGGVELHDVDTKLADRVLSQPKITAVLAVLALSPAPMPVRRDRIVGLLWPDLNQERARTALRKAVHV